MAYGVLAALESGLGAQTQDEQSRRRVRDLVRLAGAVVSDRIERFLVSEKHQAAHVDGLLHDLNQALATALSVADVVEVLARHLPRLGVPACYLSLYEEPQEISGLARLVLAYTRLGRYRLPVQGRRARSNLLLFAFYCRRDSTGGKGCAWYGRFCRSRAGHGGAWPAAC